MLQGCQHKVVTIKRVTDLSEQPCNKSDNFDKVVTSCQQVVPNLLTTCDKQCEYILLTACWQTCYKMRDFYVCTVYSIFTGKRQNADPRSVDYLRGPGLWTTFVDHSHGPLARHQIFGV
jgi:hypothetical protein